MAPERSTGLIAAVFTGMLALAAGRAEAQQVTINFVATELPTIYEPSLAAFEKANPGIKVQYQQIPFENLNAQIQARIGAKDPGIDVYGADTPRVPAFASRGYLMDLEAYRGQIEAVANKQAQNAVSYDGKIWAFPLWTSSQLLFYNRALLAKAGLTPPSAKIEDRMTWDQLLPLADKAKAGGAEWGFVFEQVDRYYQLQPIFESVGGGSGLTGEGNMKPDIANDKWVEQAGWYQKLYVDGLSPRGVAPAQVPPLFMDGKVAYYFGGPWNFGRFNNVKDLDYGVAPVPYFKGGKPVTPTDSWALGINPYSANKEAALKLATFLSLNPEGNYLTVVNNPIPPVNKEAYARYVPELLVPRSAKAGPASEILTYEIANTAVGRPRSVGYVAFEEVMNKTFSDIRNGSDPAGALKQAQTQLTSTLSRLR